MISKNQSKNEVQDFRDGAANSHYGEECCKTLEVKVWGLWGEGGCDSYGTDEARKLCAIVTNGDICQNNGRNGLERNAVILKQSQLMTKEEGPASQRVASKQMPKVGWLKLNPKE